MIFVSSERLTIRPFAKRDAPSLTAVFCDAEVMHFSDHGALDRSAVLNWLQEQTDDYRRSTTIGRWAIETKASAEVVGYIGLTRASDRTLDGETELGFRLARAFWGRGYATEAARAMVGRCFEGTETKRIIAIVDPDNRASVRVLEKLGMTAARTVMLEGYSHPDLVYAFEKP